MNPEHSLPKVYDCIIIGGGPAGLSTAIYLARFNRTVLVVDNNKGRSSWPQINENYLGFPKGISARRLRLFGRKQAQRFGAEFLSEYVKSVEKAENGLFIVESEKLTFLSKTIVFANGV